MSIITSIITKLKHARTSRFTLSASSAFMFPEKMMKERDIIALKSSKRQSCWGVPSNGSVADYVLLNAWPMQTVAVGLVKQSLY